MSKSNNLTDFLADLATVIINKEGISGPINPQDFSAHFSQWYADLPTMDGDASPDQVLAGKTFYSGSYTKQTGTIQTISLPTAAAASGSGTLKATIGRSTSDQYINIPAGYNAAPAIIKSVR